MWFAYLQRKGLITPRGYLVEDAAVADADPIEQPAPQDEKQNEKKALSPRASLRSQASFPATIPTAE